MVCGTVTSNTIGLPCAHGVDVTPSSKYVSSIFNVQVCQKSNDRRRSNESIVCMHFKRVLAVAIVFSFRTSSGKEFHNRGAAMLNSRGAHAILVIGTTSK